jgi:hypothetical protein
MPQRPTEEQAQRALYTLLEIHGVDAMPNEEEIVAVLWRGVEMGSLEVEYHDGEPRFRLTEKGWDETGQIVRELADEG